MYTLNCRGKLLVMDKPLVMGVINITPDSFYKESRRMLPEDTLAQAQQMIAAGADIIDIGGQSTRPGSERITAKEEAERVIPVVETIIQQFPGAVISVDTYYAAVAEKAVAAGASLINDISSGDMDPDMISTVAALQAPYICMHMQGTPGTMQQHPQYNDVVKEVLDYLIGKVKACTDAGIKDIIVDPGFGFGKNTTHNFRLLHDLSLLKITGKPILAGLSRKSTISRILGIPPEEALNGTTVLNTIALMNGAKILRVHDVRAAREAVQLHLAVNGEK
ncbi:MAG: dihydropteroate synthase [Sphingobacteriales bacterium]|nr:dihydropteroate synthase [Sphingobacteriales bacterium]OJY88847.1 MAG: dihydropteroate synthase [Sphingobacteriales bacterium 44-15]